MFEHDGRFCICAHCDTNREKLKSNRPPKPPALKRVRCAECCELIGVISALVLETPILYCMGCGLNMVEG
jgi:hypothetical protein